jgi:oligosaccharide repeat unit polymerase
MTSAAPTFPPLGLASLRIPAAFEVLAYLTVVASATLCFLAGWLPPNEAGAITAALLVSLVALSWFRLDRGRHPCFLFLCTLTMFQGGRLIGYCLGAEPEPLRITAMTPNPFSLTHEEQGTTLLCLALSAICIYAPCRWDFHRIPPTNDRPVRQYLPYLYLLYFASLPVQLFKNYSYYQYVQQHGGYTLLFVEHAAIAASIPFLVRVIPLITFPVLLAIFVFERRRRALVLVTVLYFATASFILLLGSRVATFSLALTLWYLARLKSSRSPRVLRFALFVLLLLFAGYVVQIIREGYEEDITSTFSPVKVFAVQGASLNVTEMAVKYRPLFSPYTGSYMWQELQNAFVFQEHSKYFRGRTLGFDVSVLLNPRLFSSGTGTGSSYVAEAYVIGGLAGVAILSTLIGFGLRLCADWSCSALSLVAVAMVLPDVLMMPRNGLLDWISVLARSAISVLLLAAGWKLFELITSVRHAPTGDALRPRGARA